MEISIRWFFLTLKLVQKLRPMANNIQPLAIIPVLPSADISRDVAWYAKQAGFACSFSDNMYALLHRENINIHLQWHAGTVEDPLNGGSVVRILVKKLQPIFKEFVERGTLPESKLVLNTAWNTNEFGFFDLNNNVIFIMQEINNI